LAVKQWDCGGPRHSNKPQGAALLRRLEQEIQDAYAHAHDCAERAEAAVTAQERTDWLFVEARWLTLARSLEFTRRLDDFCGEVRRNIKRISAVK
jgi:hypothetical protein